MSDTPKDQRVGLTHVTKLELAERLEQAENAAAAATRERDAAEAELANLQREHPRRIDALEEEQGREVAALKARVAALTTENADLAGTVRDALALVDRMVPQVSLLEAALRAIAEGPLVRDHRRHARRTLALFNMRAQEGQSSAEKASVSVSSA